MTVRECQIKHVEGAGKMFIQLVNLSVENAAKAVHIESWPIRWGYSVPGTGIERGSQQVLLLVTYEGR